MEWKGNDTSEHDRADGMQAELEGSGNAKIATAATERPEEIGICVGARFHYGTVCEHQIDGDQIVQRHPVFRHKPSKAAAEGKSSNTSTSNHASSGRKTMQLGLSIQLPPSHPTLDYGRPGGSIHVNSFHQGEVDHKAIVDHCTPSDVVAAAAYANLQSGRLGVKDSIDDIGNTSTTGNDCGASVDEAIVYPPYLIKSRRAGLEN
ncbi:MULTISPECIES: hypothetical protein [unclassified Mesorhizobium]|uniref:hypothetical protein n=2 Tax=Mesorhizobium TaxID=68287 RepID=UPI001FE05AFC|nr:MULTISPECIES: hypothetical protein [unclassified Mesorhizobium]